MKENDVQGASVESAELLVHIRREPSKSMVDEVLKYLHRSSMTAEDYKPHLRSYEMCGTIVKQHTRGRFRELNLEKETFCQTSSRQDRKHIFNMHDTRKMLQIDSVENHTKSPKW